MSDVEKKLKDYFENLAEEENITVEQAYDLIECEYGWLAVRGYDVFVSDICPLEHIERIDEMDIYSSDLEATRQCVKDAQDGLHDIAILTDPLYYLPPSCDWHWYNGTILDTEENRLAIEKKIAESIDK